IDFTNNKVYVEVDEFHGKVKIDYETIQVAIYHLIGNAAKYTKPDSTVNIKFSEGNEDIKVLFIMKSIHIETSEKEKIFNEGYSGINSKKMMKHGDGIGM